MKLFYGISVPLEKKENIKESIFINGLNVKQGNWNPGKKRKRFLSENEKLDFLSKNTKIELSSFFGNHQQDITFATADFESANYYAMKHNKKNNTDIGLVIEFTANIKDVIIDGNDLLRHHYIWDCTNEDALEILSMIYSPKIRHYIDLARNSTNSEQTQIISLIAMQDNEMIIGHLNNEIIVELGCNIPSKTHLCVKSPILSDSIIKIHDGSDVLLIPEITHQTLQNICRMKNV